MSTKAGNLLWNRKRITLDPDTSIVIDTGLQQANRAFGNSSVDEPPLGVVSPTAPPFGTTPASRVQVIPLAPVQAWTTVMHGEPYVDEATGRVFVQFINTAPEEEITINVLFWDPHTSIGPGQADVYNAPPPPVT